MTPAPASTMRMMYRCVKSESHMTIIVGSGRSAPSPWNIFANVGMTKIIMKMITRHATPMIVTG